MVCTAPIVINDTPHDAGLWQAALDEFARLSGSGTTTLSAIRRFPQHVRHR